MDEREVSMCLDYWEIVRERERERERERKGGREREKWCLMTLVTFVQHIEFWKEIKMICMNDWKEALG